MGPIPVSDGDRVIVDILEEGTELHRQREKLYQERQFRLNHHPPIKAYAGEQLVFDFSNKAQWSPDTGEKAKPPRPEPQAKIIHQRPGPATTPGPTAQQVALGATMLPETNTGTSVFIVGKRPVLRELKNNF